MFPVTKLAVKVTRLERNTVKDFAKIAQKAGADPETFMEGMKNFKGLEESKPYSKNIFKRAVIWLKTFINNYKEISKDMKAEIAKWTGLDKKALKAKKKEIYNMFKDALDKTKYEISLIKEELKKMIPSKN